MFKAVQPGVGRFGVSSLLYLGLFSLVCSQPDKLTGTKATQVMFLSCPTETDLFFKIKRFKYVVYVLCFAQLCCCTVESYPSL